MCCVCLLQERVLKCMKMIQEMPLMGGSAKAAGAAASSVPQSPIGVLDAACLSYKSDETTASSCVNSSQSSTTNKRRKLN